ncbi:MAG: thiol:disulfide interchange protein DsbA/DsbL [Pseudomonadales bacterium]|nr:thiol:disulfide interchange protein DsbA/DsbL [Pseudomonadales bacterium]
MFLLQRLNRFFLMLVCLFTANANSQSLVPDYSYQAQANAPVHYQAGTDYIVLDNPIRVADPSKIEVVEVFWYGCGHCFHFEPIIEPWVKQLPEDVNFVPMPVIWNETTELHARMFYTAKQLNKLDELHSVLFNAMNIEKKKLTKQSVIQQLFEKQGIDKKDFENAFSSFSVSSQVRLAGSRVQSYGIEGTPEIVVNGKYRVSARLTGSQEKMLEVVDFLVNVERAKNKSAATAP